MSRKDWNRPEVVMPEGKRRIRLVLSYDGTAYHGWQEQDDALSVQEVISKTLSEILGEETEVFGSGRTDAGVHALGQVAHFDTVRKIPAEKFALVLNSRLPSSIRILSSDEPEGIFHARFTAMAREYWYFIKDWRDMLPFDSGRYTALRKLPDITLLNEYASLIRGTHDFTTFCSARDICQSKWRDIYESGWTEEKDGWGRPFLKYRVTGNAFLYHQVRSMVGTMVECALKGETREEFKVRLDSKNRMNALKTYPSEGLYLARISYDEDEYRWFEEEENNGRESD